MKVQTHNARKVESFGAIEDLGSVGIRSESVAKFFTILTEKLYENPIQAVTREILTNMIDAWMYQAPDKRRPGYVSPPSSLKSNIEFTDYGPGMSLEEIKMYVGHILESSKDQTDEYHGGWGLGMKSPFAYTKNWTISSRQDGMQSNYVTVMDEAGIPKVSRVGPPAPTEEPDGLTVQIPVKDGDVDAFKGWLTFYSAYIPEEIVAREGPGVEYSEAWHDKVTVDIPGMDSFEVSFRLRKKSPEPVNISHYSRTVQTHTYHNTKKLRVVLGSVPYYELPPNHKLQSTPLDLFFPIGTLAPTPDRDRLTSESLAIVKQVLDKTVDRIREIYVRDAQKDLPWRMFGAADTLNSMRSYVFASIPTHRLPDLKTPGGLTFKPNERSYSVYMADFLNWAESNAIFKNSGNEEPTRTVGILTRDLNSRSVQTATQGQYLRFDHEVVGVYIDDVGWGSTSWFQYLTRQDAFTDDHKFSESYYRSDPRRILLIKAADPNHRGSLLLRTEDVAKVLGLRPELVQLLSKTKDRRPQRDSSSKRMSTSTKAESLAEELQYHSLVYLYAKGWIGHDASVQMRSVGSVGPSIYPRAWPYNQDPVKIGGYYFSTNRGRIDREGWPNILASELGEGAAFLQQQTYLPIERYPILFAPGVIADELAQYDNWESWPDMYERRVREEWQAQKEGSDRIVNRGLLEGWLKRETVRILRALRVLRSMADERNLEPPAFLQSLLDFQDKTLDLREFINPYEWRTASLQTHILDINEEDYYDQTEKWAMELKDRFAPYALLDPLLPTARQLDADPKAIRALFDLMTKRF